MAEATIEGIANVSFNSENSILTIEMADRSDIDIEAAKKISEKASELSQDKLHANLVDIRKMSFMSSEARKHFGGQNKKTVKAVAVISNAGFQKPLVNLYLKFSRPALPTKFFNEEEEALAWLVENLKS